MSIQRNFILNTLASRGAPFVESPDSPRAQTPSPTLRPSPFDAKVGKPKFPAGIRPPVEEALEGDIDQAGPDEDRARPTGSTGTRTVLNQYEVEAFGADPVYSSQDFSPRPVSYEIEAIRAGESGVQERPTGIDQKLGPAYVWDDVTGSYQPRNLGSLAGMFPVVGAASIGGDLFRSKLKNIAKQAIAGEEDYAVGSLRISDAQGVVQNRLIGMSPGLFGGSPQLMGTSIPDDPNIRAALIEQLRALPKTQKSGAYVPPASTYQQPDPATETVTGDTTYEPLPSIYSEPDPATEPMPSNEPATPRGEAALGTSRDPGYTGGFRATGGTVGFSEGGTTKKDPIQRTGFVEGPPQEYAKGTTVADTENLRVREGSFVINAPMTEKLQKAGVLPKGEQKRKAAKGGKMMEVALSKGEYVVEPKDVPKFGGYNFLEAVNDMGKPEVERRQAMQEGGFVTPPERSPARMAYVGKNIPRPQIPLTDNMISAFKTYNASKQQRPDVNNLIDSLNDRENLALLALAETTAEKATIEAMMGVQQTSLNRIKSTGVKVKGSPIVRPDFTKATDLKSALKQRTPGRGSGSYMFQYDGLEPKFLTPKIKDVLKGAVTKDAITKIMASSENILDPETEMGGPLFPDDVTFYTREDAPLAKDMEMNPQLRYVTTIGGHDFYAYEASPESEDEVRLYEKYLEEKRKNSSATR